MERKRNGVINLLVLLGIGVSTFAAARYANSLSGHVAVAFFVLAMLRSVLQSMNYNRRASAFTSGLGKSPRQTGTPIAPATPPAPTTAPTTRTSGAPAVATPPSASTNVPLLNIPAAESTNVPK